MNMKFYKILITALFVSVQISGQTIPDHPRVIFTVDSETELKEGLSENETLNQLNAIILANADDMTGLQPLERKVTGRRLLGVSRIYLKRILWLSYSYRMSGDKKYLMQAEKEMLSAASFSDWNPSHFLDVAEMTAALGIGYDWLYKDLSGESRQIISDAIVRHGLNPSTHKKYNGWLDGVSNWNQVCNGGMVLGALAVYEDHPELARKIIDRAKKSIKLPQEAYEPDGAYREGAGYWIYGTTYNILLISALQGVPGMEEDLYIGEGFMKTAGYHLHVAGTEGYFNYSDNGRGVVFSSAEFWFAKVLEDNSLVWNQKSRFEDLLEGKLSFNAGGASNRLLPMALIWAGSEDLFDFTIPEETSWLGEGLNPVGLHRSSWNENSIFFGIKGGSVARVGHSHMDMGTFVMDAEGVRWALDLGGHPYHALESQGMNIWGRQQDSQRWTIFRYTNRAHNTLTVDNKLIKVDGFAPVTNHSGDEDFKYTVVDLSEVYKDQLSKAVRGMALVDKSYVLLRDEITNTAHASNVRWAMVSYDNIEITGPGTAIIRKDGQELQFKVLSPPDAAIKTYTTDPKNDYENKNPGTRMIGLETDLAANETLDIVILLIPGKELPGLDMKKAMKKARKNLMEW